MSATSALVEGTLKPDGTLELDEKVPLPAGRVQVFVLPVSGLLANDPVWLTLQTIWAGQKARGHVPRTKEQIDADLRALRDEAEGEVQEAIRLQEECRQARESQGSSK